jgi:hypothetical protein
VNNVLNTQTGTAFRHGVVNSVIKHYAARLACIRAKRVCELLIGMGCGDDEIYALGMPWTPRKLLEERMLSPLSTKNKIGTWLAVSYRPVQFIGGPPNNWRAWRGSFMTLLLDRIATLTLLEGWQAMDKVIKPGERYMKTT